MEYHLPARPSRIYLNVAFEDKDEVKRRGARWDPDLKRWYVGDFLPVEDFSPWIHAPHYLKVPFAEKDDVKALTARWDGAASKWYVPDVPVSLFEQWADASVEEESHGPPKLSEDILFLDIEITGLPNKDGREYFPYTQLDEYKNARIVQISGILCDRETFAEKDKFNLIIKADDFTISNFLFVQQLLYTRCSTRRRRQGWAVPGRTWLPCTPLLSTR